MEEEQNGVFILHVDGLNMLRCGKIARAWIGIFFKSASSDSLHNFAGILMAGASDLPSFSEIN